MAKSTPILRKVYIVPLKNMKRTLHISRFELFTSLHVSKMQTKKLPQNSLCDLRAMRSLYHIHKDTITKDVRQKVVKAEFVHGRRENSFSFTVDTVYLKIKLKIIEYTLSQDVARLTKSKLNCTHFLTDF